MSDQDILWALSHSRRARFDFEKLFPDLDADSQDRLTTLLNQNPRYKSLVGDDQAFADAIQKKEVTSGVR